MTVAVRDDVIQTSIQIAVLSDELPRSASGSDCRTMNREVT